jgi:hypothetical protein
MWELGSLRKCSFQKNINLSPYLPIQTTVGNHETYGSLGMNSIMHIFTSMKFSIKTLAQETKITMRNRLETFCL